MAVARVSSNTVQSTAGTFSIPFASAPVAGNLLLLTVVGASTLSATPSFSTPTGWALAATGVRASGTPRGRCSLYWKVAAGGEANPSITATGADDGCSATVQEWSGLDPMSPIDVVMPSTNLINISGTQFTGLASTTNADDWIYSAIGGHTGITPTYTWAGGFTANVSGVTGHHSHGIATRTVSAVGSYRAQCSIDVTINGGFVAVAFKIAAPPAAQTLSPTGIPSEEAFGTPTITILGGTREVDEVYVEAETHIAAAGNVDELYVESETAAIGTVQVEQAYVEVLWKQRQWRGWGIPI